MSKEGLEEWDALVLVVVEEMVVIYLFNVRMAPHWHAIEPWEVGGKLQLMEPLTCMSIFVHLSHII